MRYSIIMGATSVGLLVTACSSTTSSAPGAGHAKTSAPSAQYPTTMAPGSPRASHPVSGPAVSLGTASRVHGKVLVGSDGHTLYLFEADKHDMSACEGACAGAWPPATATGTPKAGAGLDRALFGTIKRPDGKTQVTYNRRPLYYFAGDTNAGTANGQGSTAFGAKWFAVNASGGAASSG